MTKPLPFKQIQETKWEKWRAETFWTKEPETLKWIESFELPRSVFADVGACIGQYSLYAASLGHYVEAFEPQPANYQALLRNIGLNNFIHSIFSFQAAISLKRKIAILQINNNDTAGKSGVQIGQAGNYFIICDTLKPIYEYVKIDVDGVELEIVKGMDLKGPQLQSVLIEVSPDNRKEIIKIFYDHGFQIDMKFEPESIKEHSTNHRKASGSPVRNIVFTRGEMK